MSLTITRSVSGYTPTSVVLETLVRRDNGMAADLSPALPQSLTDEGGGVYSITVSDLAGDCAQGYTFTTQLNWPNGTFSGPYTDTTPPTGSGAVTASGPLAMAIDALTTLLSNVPFFQTWVGAANATEALANIYASEVGWPIVSASITGGVLTVTTREPHQLSIGDTCTIEGSSLGSQSGVPIDGAQVVTGVPTVNSFTASTDLEDLDAEVNPDFCLVFAGTRPIAVIDAPEGSGGLDSDSIGTGGCVVYSGELEIMLEADVSTAYQNDPRNATAEMKSAIGSLIQGLAETQDTGDLMVLSEPARLDRFNFTSSSEQNSNAIRYERWRAMIRVNWGLKG